MRESYRDRMQSADERQRTYITFGVSRTTTQQFILSNKSQCLLSFFFASAHCKAHTAHLNNANIEHIK